MRPVVLFRGALAEEGELEVCRQYFSVWESRMLVPENSLVIGRYSVLPYYDELERDLALRGSRLLNTYAEHQFIADVMNWGGENGILASLTPRSWTAWGNLPEGSYIVKGRTNSRKQQWNTHCFAATKADIPRIAQRLWDDALLKEQGLVVREYVPLKQLGEGLNGLPISNEWRTFWLKGADGKPVLLASGFYWASHPELESKARLTPEALVVGAQAALRIVEHATFFVLDLAEAAKGDWIVVEINDGQMSGLSCVDPSELYGNLKEILRCETL